jgi:hypothetical protein
VGQNDESAGISGVAAVPKGGTSNVDVGQSLSVLEIIKIRRLKEKIGTDIIEDYRCSFSERAAIREFEGGLNREEAERMALTEIVDMFMQEYSELSRECTKLLISLL